MFAWEAYSADALYYWATKSLVQNLALGTVDAVGSGSGIEGALISGGITVGLHAFSGEGSGFSLGANDDPDPIVDLWHNNTPGANLPGGEGIEIPRRPSNMELELLQSKHDAEFAVVYAPGKGKNGGGGKYFLFSGAHDNVNITKELPDDAILTHHTHPPNNASYILSSKKDQITLGKFQQKQQAAISSGNSTLTKPQNVSRIVPAGRASVVFNKKGVLLPNNDILTPFNTIVTKSGAVLDFKTGKEIIDTGEP